MCEAKRTLKHSRFASRKKSWGYSGVKVVGKDCSVYTTQSGCLCRGYHVRDALSNMENWISPCLQDLATGLPVNLKFHTVTVYVMNGEEHNHVTVSAETVVRRWTLGGL